MDTASDFERESNRTPDLWEAADALLREEQIRADETARLAAEDAAQAAADEAKKLAEEESRIRVGVFRVLHRRTVGRDPQRTRYHTNPVQSSEEFWQLWHEKRERMYAEFRRQYDERNRPYRELQQQLERKKEADRADRKVHLQEIREHIQSIASEPFNPSHE